MPPWLLLTLLLPVVYSASSVVQTQAVSYCAPPVGIVVDTFDVRYSNQNSSLYFDLGAASVTQGLNLTAQISLNAYGRSALNLSIDLCSVLSGVLCPLPTYNFTGSGQYTIPPESVPRITSLAWTVPDIEAVFSIQLFDSPSGANAACLQVTLTNTLTVGLPAVVWSSASLWILASLFSFLSLSFLFLHSSSVPLAHSFVNPQDSQSHQFLVASATWFYLLTTQLQNMALTGVLSLNYPVVLRTWATNFAYSLGLIYSHSISHSIDSTRSKTGGNQYQTSPLASRFISRQFSPYNDVSSSVNPNIVDSPSAPLLSLSTVRNLLASSVVEPASADNPTQPLGPVAATQAPRNVLATAPTSFARVFQNSSALDPGLAAYTEQSGFPVENSFMILFIWFLILIACLIVFMLAILFIRPFLVKDQTNPASSTLLSVRDSLVSSDFRFFSLTVLHRLNLAVYPAFSFLTFQQWKLGSSDSWVPILFSVLVWLLLSLLMIDLCLNTVGTSVLGLFTPAQKAPETSRIQSVSSIATATATTLLAPTNRPDLSLSVLVFFNDRHRFWIAPIMGLEVLRMAFLGFGQGSAQTQVIPQMIIGLIQTVILFTLRGRLFRLKYANALAILLSLLNLIRYGLLEAFVKSNSIEPIPRAIMGFVFIAIDGIGIIALFIFALGYLVSGLLGLFATRGDVEVAQPANAEEKDNKPEE